MSDFCHRFFFLKKQQQIRVILVSRSRTCPAVQLQLVGGSIYLSTYANLDAALQPVKEQKGIVKEYRPMKPDICVSPHQTIMTCFQIWSLMVTFDIHPNSRAQIHTSMCTAPVELGLRKIRRL